MNPNDPFYSNHTTVNPQFPNNSPPPNSPQGLEARFYKAPTWARWGLISLSGLIFISTAIFLMVLVGVSFDQPTVAAAPTQQPTIAQPIVTPTPSPTPSPTPVPTATPTPDSVQPGVQPSGGNQSAPPTAQQPTSGNPWGYDFNPGSYIYNPNPNFCDGTYFSCIDNFSKGTGYVVECGDGLYSKSGGKTGVCSGHGGRKAILYQH